MEALKKYKIDIYNLSPGDHEYVFEFDSDFLNSFEKSLLNVGSGEVKVLLNREETFIELGFEITGSVLLTCDRSLELFDFPLNLIDRLLFKFGDKTIEQDKDDIIFIPWNTPSINISQFIYEFISVAVPMKKLHPRYANEDMTNDELIYSSNNENEHNKEYQNKPEEVDPRWQKLQELKKNIKTTSK